MGAFFHEIFTRPTLNALMLFYRVFDDMSVPGAFGFAIIALTIMIRLIFHPLFKKQTEMTLKMQELKPELDALSKKYKDDKKRLQEEQLKLYKTKGVNPAGGCLIAIIQLPVFIALYKVIFQFVEVGNNAKKVVSQINAEVYTPALKLSAQHINPHFFGIDLTATPSQFTKLGLIYLAFPIVTAILQYYQIKLASPVPPAVAEDKSEKKGKKGDDMQTMMSTQMRLLFPFMIGYFSYTLPLGLSLYWNIFSIFSIIQYTKKSAPKKS